MKSRIHYLASVTLFSCVLGMSVYAEYITLQIPLARAGHSFSLYEKGTAAVGDVTLEVDAGIAQMGYEPGTYIQRATGQSAVMGGFWLNGEWQAGGDSYLSLSVLRQGTSAYFVMDDTATEASPQNLNGLVLAPWRSWYSSQMVYFAFPAARVDHALALESNGVIFSLSKGVTQGYFDAAGDFHSYGYFEAWTSGVDLTNPNENWQLLDFTTHESTPAVGNLLGATWTPNTAANAVGTITMGVTAAQFRYPISSGSSGGG